MSLTPQEIKKNDKDFFQEFSTIGCRTHVYTSKALYNEYQRVARETDLCDERSVIVTILRAKTYSEAVNSMETLGKFMYAVTKRSSDGIASLYTASNTGKTEAGLKIFSELKTDKSELDKILGILKFPSLESIPRESHQSDIRTFLVGLVELLNAVRRIYFNDDKFIVRIYEKVKHGASLSMGLPKIDNNGIITALPHVWLMSYFPRRDQTMDDIRIASIGMPSDDRFAGDIEMCAGISNALYELSLILLRLLEEDRLAYTF